MNEMISVIVPVYNCEQFIKTCIESILSQSYSNFELILVNDGSSDLSYDICKEYEATDNRVRVYSHKNCGVAKTREKGYQVSKGDYIVYVDSDDMLEVDFLSVLLKGISQNDADVVCCNSIDDGVVNQAICADEYITDKAKLIQSFFSGKRYSYCVWAKMYRKEILSGISFMPLKYAEDTYYVNEVFQKAKGIQLISYAGYHYRDNINGAMRKAKGIQQEKDVLVLLEFMRELCQNQYPEYVVQSNKRIGDGLFNLIINASVMEKQSRMEAKKMVDSFIKKEQKILKLSNIKHLVVFLYYHFPNIMNIILVAYRKHMK